MKKVSNNKIVYVLMLMFFIVALSSCKNKTTTEDVSYTCPMHPDVIKNEPSTCPICAMDLVRLHKHTANGNSDLNLSDSITKEGIISNTKTIYLKSKTIRDTILINGVIKANTNKLKTVSSYFSGRIEKLYLNYNFQKVTKGQKIMEVYSPDLVAAQQELLYLNNSGDKSLMNKAKTKLSLLGMKEQDIDKVLSQNKVLYSISIYSTGSGYIVDNTTDSNPDNMTKLNSPLNLRQGMYIETGEALFKIYDDSSVWAEFSANANVSKNLNPKGDISISITKDDWVNTKINSILPFYNGGENFSNIRVQLDNVNKKYKIGELVKGKIISDEITGLWTPKTAVYESGGRTIVFIKKKNKLQPLDVVIRKIGNETMVLSGLDKTDEIAETAAHLVDPEAFIN